MNIYLVRDEQGNAIMGTNDRAMVDDYMASNRENGYYAEMLPLDDPDVMNAYIDKDETDWTWQDHMNEGVFNQDWLALLDIVFTDMTSYVVDLGRKSHYEYDKKYIGFSDYVSLTLRFADDTAKLDFGMGADDGYEAYIVDEDCYIPSDFVRVASGEGWLRIYDDEGLAFKTQDAGWIRVYRAGEFGCIIQIFGGKE